MSQPVTLVATVNPPSATGIVVFYAGVSPLGQSTLSGGHASFTTALLPAGTNQLRATYGGDAANSSTVSPIVIQRVNALPVTTFVQGSGTVPTQPAFIPDFNGDGIPDSVTLTDIPNPSQPGQQQTSISIALGDGNGGFKPAPGGPYLTPATVTAAQISYLDINGDGKLDFLILDDKSSNLLNLLFFIGNGDGSFPRQQSFSNFGNNFLMADFNGDGIPDYISVFGRLITIYSGVSDSNGFHLSQTFGYRVTGGQGLNGITVGDFNNDGKPDLALTADPGRLIVFLNDGTGKFGPEMDTQLPDPRGGGLLVGDFNGDGNLDLGTFANGGLLLLLGDGKGNFTPSPTVYPSGGGPVSVGDFNSDGRTDIAFGSSILYGSNSGPIAKLVFIAQPANGIVVGQPFPTVQVAFEDANGSVVTAANGPITLNSPFSSVTVNAVNGIASFPNFLQTSQAGTYTLTAASGNLLATSNSFRLLGGPPYSISLTSADLRQPDVLQPFTPLTGSATAKVFDTFGNPASGAVSITTFPPAGFGGITSLTTDNGVALFNNLQFNQPGLYKLDASSPGNNTNCALLGCSATVAVYGNISNFVRVTTSGFVYSRVTGSYVGTMTVTNTSPRGFNAPYEVLFNIRGGATLLNASGQYRGLPYVTIPSATFFSPGQTVSFPLSFRSTTPIDFTQTIVSGSLP